MNNAKAKSIILTGIVLVAFLSTALVGMGDAYCAKKYPAGSPTRAIQDLDDTLDEFTVAPIGGKLTAAQEEHNRQVKRKIIHGTFDIRELSKLSLANHWSKRTPAEQDAFVTLLTNLLEEKALFSKEQSIAKTKKKKKSDSPYYVKYGGHKFMNKDKTKAYVRTMVVVPSENIDITLNYRLKKQGGEWKIYDIIVDEASLVDNYKYQFDKIIRKDGYNELIGRMNNKLKQIQRQRREEDGAPAGAADKKA